MQAHRVIFHFPRTTRGTGLRRTVLGHRRSGALEAGNFCASSQGEPSPAAHPPRRSSLGLALLLAILSATSAAQTPISHLPSPISPHLLSAIAAVESGNRNIPGDHGRAAGPFQLHAAACADTGHPHAAAWTPAARDIAATYLTGLFCRLSPVLGRSPSAGELYAAYNLGFAGFQRRGFNHERCPRRTRAAALAVERMVWAAESAALDAQFAEISRAAAKLAAATYRRADGTLQLNPEAGR